MYQGFFALFLAIFLAACTKTPTPNQNLEDLLVGVGASTSEAKKLSHVAHKTTLLLKSQYGSTLPPRWHNTLVNLGLKSRGLCWHYAHDLHANLAPLTKQLEAIIVVAHLDSYWQEHSAVVLTCKGCEIGKGIVLDAWRDSNGLFYLPVTKDSYPWRIR
jgi:hypothetical protein